MSLGSIVYMLLMVLCAEFVSASRSAMQRNGVLMLNAINFFSIMTKRLAENQINQMKHRRQNYEKSAENRVR